MEDRFEVVYQQEIRNDDGYLYIHMIVLKDKLTGVFYLCGNKGQFTPLIDKDGKPLKNFAPGEYSIEI